MFVDVRLLDSQCGHIDPAFRRPVENRRLKSLGAHHRAVDLLRRKSFEIIDDILIRHLQRLDRSESAFFNNAAERLRSGYRRRAPKGQELRLDDSIARRVFLVALYAKHEFERVSARHRTVFADAVRVFKLSDMRSRLTLNCVHKKTLRLLAILPSHFSLISEYIRP